MESVWMDAKMPRFEGLKGDVRTDVLVIGGGMAGLLCAHMLRRAGIDCLVAEAERIGGGVTKNTTAKLTSQHGLIYHKLISRFDEETAGLYLQANEAALGEYRALCRNIDCDYSEQDSFVYSVNDPLSLDRELEALQRLGFPGEYAGALPLPFPTAGAVKFPRQAQFHPLKFLSAISRELPVFENTPVRQLTKHTAITDHGTITADAMIVATHFPFLNKHGSYFLKLYQDRSYVLALENGPRLEGMYRDAESAGLSFRSHGDALLLGGGGHRTGCPGEGWQGLERFASEYYPGAKITHRWATQDCMSLDGLPYIGQYGGSTPGLYVAAGFSKWGMTGAMTAAMVLRDRILGKDSPYTELFTPGRSMLHPQLWKNLLESSKNLLSLSPRRCPHMGCALKWNPQEHSWDCPCHGSRFTAQGKLIDNPATGDLKKRV